MSTRLSVIRRIVIAFSCVLMAASSGAAELMRLPPQPSDVPWPTQEWPTGPLPPGADTDALRTDMDDAFQKKLPLLGETRQVVIIQGGRLVYEQYASGYPADMPLVSWSMAKSLTQALVGVAVAQGKVNIDQPMGSPHWKADDRRAQIPWRTWLQMTDGQRYLEIEAPSIADSDASRKLFGPGRLDVARYCAGLPLIHDPGTFWNYNSCGIVLTADALTRTIVADPQSPEARRAAMLTWMHENLFDVIGMHAQPEFDAAGLYYGSALIYATARDFAKFGLLYLRDGTWDGRRVLPEGWVDFARSPGTGKNSDVYGAGWWINPPQGMGRPYETLMEAGAARDVFSAEGFEGQYILVVPSKDLVIVRLGRTEPSAKAIRALRDWLQRVGQAFPPVMVMPISAPSTPAPTSE